MLSRSFARRAVNWGSANIKYTVVAGKRKKAILVEGSRLLSGWQCRRRPGPEILGRRFPPKRVPKNIDALRESCKRSWASM
jgi:hypothetical protein